ncbi:MAG: hypothetical protein ACRDGM_05740 [bacterium]
MLLLLAVLLLLPTASQTALAQSEPTIVKDSVRVTLQQWQYGPTRRGDAPPAWSPTLNFRVNEPTKNSRIWVEVSYPGKKPWLTGDCVFKSEFAGSSAWECLGGHEKESIRFTGLVDFSIHISNELMGTNLVLFRGKAKVGKTPPHMKDRISDVFYVDEDWRIPIGYLSRGNRAINFEFEFPDHWVGTSAHLFHQGKPVAEGINCAGQPVSCEFFAGNDAVTELSPGEYEVKVLKDGRLRRTAKFTVAEDGSYDNGIATANQLGSKKVIIPVAVVGNFDDPWDKLAWKTEAFYGNPLTGFTAPP